MAMVNVPLSEESQVVSLEQEASWRQTFRRFLRHRMAILGLFFLSVLTLSAIFAPLLAPYSPNAIHLSQQLLPPSQAHWLGTDSLGRDEFTRLLYGGQVSLMVGFFTMLVATTLGTFVGSVAGYFGGWTDVLLMRFVDYVLSFPAIFLLLILINLSGGKANVLEMVMYLGFFGWTGTARIVRGQFLTLREMEFVEAAKASGATGMRVIFRHILPNSMAPILVSAAFKVAEAMLAEASLDYLGFGLPPSIPSWGNLLTSANTYFVSEPWLAIAPGLIITFTVVSIFFIGDALRDALDPKVVR